MQSRSRILVSLLRESEDTCRICFNNVSKPENPLVSACNCAGSMKFMHFECIKTWINLKLVEKNTPRLATYHWKQYACEICKEIYPRNSRKMIIYNSVYKA